MTFESSQTKLLKRYLLGELSDADQTRLEEQYFSDADLFHELRTVRDDLIDAYVRDELSKEERDKVELFFRASPRRQERIEFAEALLQTVASPRPRLSKAALLPAAPWWQFISGLLKTWRQPIFAAAALVVLIGISWLVVRTLRERQRTESESAGLSAPQSPAPTPLVTHGASSSPQTPGIPQSTQTPINSRPGHTPESEPVVATFLLTPDLVRGPEETQKVVISKKVTNVRLQLSLEGQPYSSYRAEVRTPEGRPIWSTKQLRVHIGNSGRVVILSLPANLLNNADYTIRLNGVTSEKEVVNVGNYYFRVETR